MLGLKLFIKNTPNKSKKDTNKSSTTVIKNRWKNLPLKKSKLDGETRWKNSNPTTRGAYPIATLTWILAYKNGNGTKAKVIQDTLNYLLSDEAQSKAPGLGFVPLKGDILNKSREAIKKIGE